MSSVSRLDLSSVAGAFAVDGDAVEKTAPVSVREPALSELGVHLPAPGETTLEDALDSLSGMRVLRSDGATNQLPADIIQLREDSKGRSQLRGVVARRPASVQSEIDRRLTEAFAADEQTFEIKDPRTGRYQIATVPIHGTIAPIDGEAFDRLVESTAPVMHAFRDILRVVYSNPSYTAADLGIEHLPEKERETVLHVLRNSLYFEPALVCDAMKEFPFLGVAGFDASLGDPEDPVFFECNFGTPAGIETNIQLQEKVRALDPEQFASYAGRLRKDDTFDVLRKTIEDNALSWTKNPDGISVIVSPGPSSGGHQDAASTAEFAGMPMVVPQDLYEDAQGWIRLHTGDADAAKHPVVTGIYSRAEESWLLQNAEDRISFRTPERWDNAEIGKRIGVELQNGVSYRFRYGANREVVGVQTDASGKPALPYAEMRTGGGSLARALKSRKLYVSCVGGRTADDKRLFEIVAKYVAPKYSSGPIARPPSTLKQAPEEGWTGFVIKEPDRSGGDGVHVLATKTEAEQRKIIDHARAHPDRVMVQELASLGVTIAANGNEYGTLAVDGRLVVMMDSKGEVRSGPNAMMLRTSWPGGLMCNMSSGGGVAPVAVLDAGAKRSISTQDSLFPERPLVQHLGKTDRAAVRSFLEQLKQLMENRRYGAGRVAESQRRVMHIFGMVNRPLMATLRAYDAGKVSEEELLRELTKTRDRLLRGDGPTAAIDDEIKRVFDT